MRNGRCSAVEEKYRDNGELRSTKSLGRPSRCTRDGRAHAHALQRVADDGEVGQSLADTAAVLRSRGPLVASAPSLGGHGRITPANAAATAAAAAMEHAPALIGGRGGTVATTTAFARGSGAKSATTTGSFDA